MHGSGTGRRSRRTRPRPPPGYRRSKPPVRPKLDPFIDIIDRILEEDKERPKKQRHTSKRIYERLRDEHGFTGGITIVKDYICGARRIERRPPRLNPDVYPDLPRAEVATTSASSYMSLLSGLRA